MIKTFRHKGLNAFFEQGTVAGIQPVHAPRLAAMLRRLDVTTGPQGMNLPGWNLHPLKGNLKGHRSEEHTSELQSLMRISYAVFCLKKQNNNTSNITISYSLSIDHRH